MSKMTVTADAKPMLNAYPDSVGGTLSDITGFLQKPELKDVFSSFYILPSVFNTDLDRGFSVIDYTLNEELADKKDLEALEELGINLKLDFILNHASVLSRQFQDILKNGDDSKYRDFFIDWNKFWEGKGTMTEEGYIQPDQELIEHMFFRKPGLPILMVRFPDGKNVPYWNTFYQEIKYPVLDAQDIMQVAKVQYYKADLIAKKVNEEIAAGKKPSELNIDTFCKDSVVELLESKRKYLGQMDLNIKSPLVWEFYDETLKTLAAYGAKIVRLDAFAYAPKEPGEKNFLNEPGTWEVLEKVRKLADKYNLTLLPEIHASYGEKNYEQIAKQGYMTYDFFLPGMIIDALESGNGSTLEKWAKELMEKELEEKKTQETSNKEQNRKQVISCHVTAYTVGDAYTPSDTMANGEKVHVGAVASYDLPLGTKVRINGVVYTVKDRCGVPDTLDIYMNSKQECMRFGKRYMEVEIL